MANRQAEAFKNLLTQYEQSQEDIASLKAQLTHADTIIKSYQTFLNEHGYNLPLMSREQWRDYVQSQWDLAMR